MTSTARAFVVGVCILGSSSFAHAEDVPPLDGEALAGDLSQIQTLGPEALADENVSQSTLTIGLSTQTMTASDSGNTVTADSIRSGDITFSADALAGFSGIGNFVLNTGNNNTLQGGISVVVVLPGQ